MRAVDNFLIKALVDHNSRIENNPTIFDGYFRQLNKSIKNSTLLSFLYSEGCNVNNNNWVTACGTMDHVPYGVLRNYFGIDRRPEEWWDHIPYKTFFCETDDHKWWFSVFDEYELRSIDFYYPTNPIEGEGINVIVHSWGNDPVDIRWVHKANGLTMFCLLPCIFLFAMELTMSGAYIDEIRSKKVLDYARTRMMRYTKSIRDKIPVNINF